MMSRGLLTDWFDDVGAAGPYAQPPPPHYQHSGQQQYQQPCDSNPTPAPPTATAPPSISLDIPDTMLVTPQRSMTSLAPR